MSKKELLVPEERIINLIVLLRDEKVMLDVHLAELYQVETRVLKQAVRRNEDRFPEDFMFELTDEEVDQVVSQSVIPSKSHFGGAVPFAFTEYGVAMPASVLKSEKAIQMSIAIVRTFVMLRKIGSNYQEVMKKVESMESKYDNKFKDIYKALNYLLNSANKRKPIGFRQRKK